MARKRQRQGGQQQGGQRQGPKASIKVGYLGLKKQKRGDKYSATLTATVAEGGRPGFSLLVQFQLDRVSFGNLVSTNPEGLATIGAGNLLPRNYLVGAQVVGTLVRDEVLMSVGAPKPKADKELEVAKRAADLTEIQKRQAEAARNIADLKKEEPKPLTPPEVSVRVFGEGKRKKLQIVLTSKDGKLISGFTATILDGNESKVFTSGPNGSYIYKVVPTAGKKVVEVMTGSKPEQMWSGIL